MARLRKDARSFERLESRAMLTAISAGLTNTGALLIVGNNSNNHIAITQVGTNGNIPILEVDAPGSKIFNEDLGITGSSFLFQPTGDVVVQLKGGKDSVQVSDLDLDTNVYLDAGSGSNQITVANCSLDGALQVTAGSGNNQVSVDHTDIGSSLLIDLRQTKGSTTQLTNLDIGDRLVFESGDRRDSLTVDTVDVGESSNQSSLIYTHGGKDTVSIANYTDEALAVVLGKGNDQLTIGTSTIGSGGNTTTLSIYGAEVSDSRHDGNDKVSLTSVTADAIFAALGSGNHDQLNLSGVTANGHSLDGGVGNHDELISDGSNPSSLGAPVNGSPLNFETVSGTI